MEVTMTKTDKALRIELEDLKNKVYEMTETFNKEVRRERIRVDRVVQILLNTLPKEQLRSKVTFSGIDCCGNYRNWSGGYYGDGRTLFDFLQYIIDP
jgi:hypothetical protein